MVCTFFQPFSTLPRRVDYDLADMAKRQSPGTPTFLTPVGPTKEFLFMKYLTKGNSSATKDYSDPPRPDGHTHPKYAITLRAYVLAQPSLVLTDVLKQI